MFSSLLTAEGSFSAAENIFSRYQLNSISKFQRLQSAKTDAESLYLATLLSKYGSEKSVALVLQLMRNAVQDGGTYIQEKIKIVSKERFLNYNFRI